MITGWLSMFMLFTLLFVFWSLVSEPLRFLGAWLSGKMDLWRERGNVNLVRKIRRKFALYYIPCAIFLFVFGVVIIMTLVDSNDSSRHIVGTVIASLILFLPIVVIPLTYLIEFYLDDDRVMKFHWYAAVLITVFGLPGVIKFATIPLVFESLPDDVHIRPSSNFSDSIGLLAEHGIFVVNELTNKCESYLINHWLEDFDTARSAEFSVANAQMMMWLDRFLNGITFGVFREFGCSVSPIEIHPGNHSLKLVSVLFTNTCSVFAVTVLLGPFFFIRKLLRRRAGTA